MTQKDTQAKTCQVSILPRATPEDLAPLLQKLSQNEEISEQLIFPRGTLLADGRLDLCKQALGPEGTRAVAGALRQNTFVKSLLLGADQMGPEGAFAIAGLLGENHSLRTVFLGCNHIGPQGAKAIAESLQKNDRVNGLWIKRNEIGPEGARSLAEMLRHNKTLATLDLVSNDLGVTGARLLCEALLQKDAAPIEALYLCGNQLGVEGARLLAELLKGSTSLKALYTAANHFGDEGAKIIAEALAENDRLCTLSLASNDIGPEGVKALLDALQKNTTLTTLELGFAPATYVLQEQPNRIGDEGAALFAAFLAKNESLLSLDLGRNNISERGASLLMEGLSKNRSLVKLELGVKLPSELQQTKTALLCRNANLHRRRPLIPRQDVLDIRSVYRTAKAPIVVDKDQKTQDSTPTKKTEAARQKAEDIQENSDAEALNLTQAGFSKEELESCQKVLRALTLRRHLLSDGVAELRELRTLAKRVARLERSEAKHALQKEKKSRRRSRDFQLILSTGIRMRRGVALYPEPKLPEEPDTRLSGRRACYICKKGYDRLHFFYDSLCPTCAAFNYQKRQQSADLNGKIALVTGGRVKIGFQVALKLLRAGAQTIVTTRFPHDAARRFSLEPDFAQWKERLQIFGLDLRALPLVERFGDFLCEAYPKLDILIQNAAQTIRKPVTFYQHLFTLEETALEALPAKYQPLLLTQKRFSEALYPHKPGYLEVVSQLSLPSSSEVSAARDEHDQPIDLRTTNSWRLQLDEVSTAELLEVHAINTMAPFILNSRLKRLLLRAPGNKYIVNVSAMEGQFYKYFKNSTHPHTNMAKAALNMMTRTSAQEYAQDNIFMNSVDTGWITDENPMPIAQHMKEKGFAPPLDEVDAAARILDPVFDGLNTGQNRFGEFLKDFYPAPW